LPKYSKFHPPAACNRADENAFLNAVRLTLAFLLNRRSLLRRAAALAFLPVLPKTLRAAIPENAPARRVRPGDPSWPSEASWAKLKEEVGGRLIKVQSPLSACREAPDATACGDLFKELKNPYYIGDNVALTQTAGWVDAWESQQRLCGGGRDDG
jgi:hypothetical protein